MKTYTFHPIADIFPLMQGEEFEALVADIQDHGLREPIWIYQDKIIDGRNRYKACQEVDIDPTFREWKGHGTWDLITFVVSLNLHRRHLDETGRAIVGAKLKPIYAAEARERQATSSGGAVPQLRANLHEAGKGRASDYAAHLINVSSRLIDSADRVLKEGTAALIRAMETGQIPASRAETLVDASPDFQEAVVYKLEKGSKPMEAIRQVKAETIRQKEATMPSGKYRVLYADPPWSYGLGYAPQAIDAIIAESKNPAVLAGKAAPLTEHGEIGNGRSRGNAVTSTMRGNAKEYRTAKIARDAPDVLERMKAGEFASVAGQRSPTCSSCHFPTPQ